MPVRLGRETRLSLTHHGFSLSGNQKKDKNSTPCEVEFLKSKEPLKLTGEA
jgi:hypothetical protein